MLALELPSASVTSVPPQSPQAACVCAWNNATNQPVSLSRSHTAWPRACLLMPLHSMSAPAHAPAKPAPQQTRRTSQCPSRRSAKQAVSLVSELLAPAACCIVS